MDLAGYRGLPTLCSILPTPLCSPLQLNNRDTNGRSHRNSLSLSSDFAITSCISPVTCVCPHYPHLLFFFLLPLKSTPIGSQGRSFIPSTIFCIPLHKGFIFLPLFFLIGARTLIETFWVKTFLDVNGQQRRQKWNCCNFNEYIQFYYFKSRNIIAFSILKKLKKFSPIINRILMEMAEAVIDGNSH